MKTVQFDTFHDNYILHNCGWTRLTTLMRNLTRLIFPPNLEQWRLHMFSRCCETLQPNLAFKRSFTTYMFVSLSTLLDGRCCILCMSRHGLWFTTQVTSTDIYSIPTQVTSNVKNTAGNLVKNITCHCTMEAQWRLLSYQPPQCQKAPFLHHGCSTAITQNKLSEHHKHHTTLLVIQWAQQ